MYSLNQKDNVSLFVKPVLSNNTLDAHTQIVTLVNKSVKMLLHDTVGGGSLKIQQTLKGI